MDSVKQIAVESGETFPSEMSFGKDTMNCALIVYFSHSIVILFNPAVPPGLCVLLVAKSSYPPHPALCFTIATYANVWRSVSWAECCGVSHRAFLHVMIGPASR